MIVVIVIIVVIIIIDIVIVIIIIVIVIIIIILLLLSSSKGAGGPPNVDTNGFQRFLARRTQIRKRGSSARTMNSLFQHEEADAELLVDVSTTFYTLNSSLFTRMRCVIFYQSALRHKQHDDVTSSSRCLNSHRF